MERKLKKISKQLKGASKLHAGQAKKIDNMIKKSSALNDSIFSSSSTIFKAFLLLRGAL